MNPRSSFANRWRWPLSLAATAALAALLLPAAARAQEKQFALRFSSKSGDPAPRASMPLRPNLAQDFFIYVDNLNAQAGTVTVEIRAGGKPIDGGVKEVAIDKTHKFTQVSLGKPPEKAPPVQPGAAPPPPPPPVFEAAKGPLTIVLLDVNKKVIDEVPLTIAHPKEYLEQPKITFYPTKGDLKNQLRVELKAKSDTFAGPPCRVDLVLDPHRIPGLIEKNKAGTRGGFLAAPGAELVLTADNLEFADNKEQNGFVYLTVDGWERAFTFSTSFPREGTESTPDRVNTPIVRLLAPALWNPAEPLPVKVQADNLDQQVVELSFDRDNDGKFSKLNGEIFDFQGERDRRLLFNPTYPGGALQLKPEVRDWQATYDVAEVFGKRNLRVRLLKNAAEAAKPDDAERAIDPNLNKAFGGTEPVTELRAVVLLDANPPSGIKFVLDKIPKKLVVGDSVPVSATCEDPASVKQVVFFVGKLDPDGKIPKTAVLVPGELTDKEKGVWSADLDAPTLKKGKFDVTVQFVKTTGVAATDTIKIELIDPTKPVGGPGGPGGPGSIEGKITDVGGAPQGAGVPVELRDDKGNVKDTTKTDEKSHYIFKDLLPATYQIVSVRTATRTKGSVIVQVKPGEALKNVDVGLSR